LEEGALKTTQSKVSRRTFLFGAAAGSAATAAAIVAKKTNHAEPQDAAHEESSKGYQLSEHVRNYYRTAKI
jgi:peptidase E